jgi:hypothetical protein
MCIVVADGRSVLNFASPIEQTTLPHRGLDSETCKANLERLFSLLQNGHSSKWNKWDKDSACEDFGKERPPLQPYICSS